jgi:hypothetical protein
MAVAMRFLLAFGLLTSLASEAEAKTGYESPYSYERTWNAATRLVRVDLGLKIVERDENTGYVLFEYKSSESGSKTSSGSMEIVRKEDGASVLVQLPDMPRYHEQVLADQLARKLRAEYGEPPLRHRNKDAGAPPPPPDGG